MAGSSSAQPVLLHPERDAPLDGHRRVRRELSVGPCQDRIAAGIPAVPGAEQPAGTRHVVARVGCQDERAGRPRRGLDPLHEPFRDVLHQPCRPTHHLRRAAIVGRQVDPSQPGQPCCEVEDPSDVGQPPGVDRLVVVADEEDVARLPGQQQRQLQLGPVEVLRLVHEQHPRPLAPQRQRGRVARAGPAVHPPRGRPGRASSRPPAPPGMRRTLHGYAPGPAAGRVRGPASAG